MRRVYTILLYLLIPYILLRLYWKGRHLPAYRLRIPERFALSRMPYVKADVWVHAVSLGEVNAAIPLIEELLSTPYRVLVTTMTPTGSERVVKHFGSQVAHHYIPYDFPWALRRFFKKTNAKMGIIMETELWPNMIYYATRAHIPLLLANARLSDTAFAQYQKLRFFFTPVLNQFTSILAQSEEDARRFIALGAEEHLVAVGGNMKFDLQARVRDIKVYQQIKASWGQHRKVIIAASTHDDEEHQLLTRLNQLKASIPGVLLLIAPRHPERFQIVYQMSQELGFNSGLRSQAESIDLHTEVMVIDSLGELLGFYQICDYAFVGGSLVPVGGHNVLEAIAMQVPVFSGPYTHNFKTICQDLSAAEAIQVVGDADQLVDAIITMYQNTHKVSHQVNNANTVLTLNKGSVMRHIDKIKMISGNSIEE